jgi:hypothetical protein
VIGACALAQMPAEQCMHELRHLSMISNRVTVVLPMH